MICSSRCGKGKTFKAESIAFGIYENLTTVVISIEAKTARGYHFRRFKKVYDFINRGKLWNRFFKSSKSGQKMCSNLYDLKHRNAIGWFQNQNVETGETLLIKVYLGILALDYSNTKYFIEQYFSRGIKDRLVYWTHRNVNST